jgi:hypothetical protein
MAIQECPVCGKSIKVENMNWHLANVRPGKDVSVAIAEAEHCEIREGSRGPGPTLLGRRWFQASLVCVLVLAVGYVGLPYVPPGLPSASNLNLGTHSGVGGPRSTALRCS